MNLLRLAAASLNQTPLDWAGNRQRIVQAIEEARRKGAGLLVLPELAVTGYGCEDWHFSAAVQRGALDSLVELLPATHGMAVCVGLPLFVDERLYNGAAMIADGRLLGITCKQHLATDGLHYEPRWFRPWPAGAVGAINVGGGETPVGDLLYDLDGVRVGVEVCRDAWVADRPGRRLAQRGADVILNPSASHFSFGKQDVRRRFVIEGSRTFGVAYAYCNLLGNESGQSIFDGGTLIASQGNMVAAGRRLRYDDFTLSSAAVDIDQCRRLKSQAFEAGPRPADAGGATIVCDFSPRTSEDDSPSPPLAAPHAPEDPWEGSADLKHEEFARAVPLALFDYLRKSRTRGFVVSLSGGADSAAVALLVSLMAREGLGQLGAEGLAKRLPAVPGLEGVTDPQELIHRLLACVYQSTRNSSETTRRAAAGLAHALGAEFLAWDVDPMVDRYTTAVGEARGARPDWEHDDAALQNIQARARGPGAWMLANLRSALLLATGNRSEAAVGYATMDGDTCGGLAPIGGVDKAYLREWLDWMETTGPDLTSGRYAVAELAAVNAQAPTAELRPADAAQTDEGDLMPYPVLDAIERAALVELRPPLDALRLVAPLFPEVSREQMAEWVERFFRLWNANQWKRERLAAAFHVDDHSVDPRGWGRFPILSNGFEQELEELRRIAK
ncbi:Glutamine-dependent NAD(+) synthetase [Pseudobythopirellula maris]|uniref:Glutamine-dependent NAD(+) synthetase n=1 Tax=Pseudobythopirellula maris TaxID=2527991 RepID=A0A5C5ZST4_9BACT|nr:NAD(+) synthase [Pseudobythopirellula maris]TWT90594.1 Glutamine-dependent NAD(+) synthetase [Pseudobythopirellula maris]